MKYTIQNTDRRKYFRDYSDSGRNHGENIEQKSKNVSINCLLALSYHLIVHKYDVGGNIKTETSQSFDKGPLNNRSMTL